MTRVLIVDDSPTLRQLTRAILERDPELDVVGEGGNGEEAIALCDKLRPDIITMDIRMPKMNGFQAIRHIMADSPRPIVVLTTPDSDKELQITFKAIEAGALMVLAKPNNLSDHNSDSEKLIATVKSMASVKVVHRSRRLLEETASPPPTQPRPGRPYGPVRLIALGASTGGPPALQTILKRLPADLPVPVVVVQHMSEGFTAGFVRWLDETVPLRVKMVEGHELLGLGTVYLAPDKQHLLVTKHGLAWLRDSAPVDGHRPSVTVLFNSVAESYGPTAVGVLLTGMGADGAQGLKTLREAGGYTIAQNEETCVVYGMPKQAIALDAAEEVLPLKQVGERLGTLVTAREEAWRS